MKIGIITHHYINNYGAFLQAFALQQTLISLCPEAEVIVVNYIVTKHQIMNTRPLLVNFQLMRLLLRRPDVLTGNWHQLMQFVRSRKLLHCSARVRTAQEINRLNCDVIIIGSDEVWSVDSVSTDPVKFGLGITSRLISYAPSVGAPSRHVHGFVSEGLSRFSAISVRDRSTFDLVTSHGIDSAETVLDPTFLYEFPSAQSEPLRSLRQPYILVYQCELGPEQVRHIRYMAQAAGLKIVGGGCYAHWFDIALLDVSPFDWVELFRAARYVITGTYHGTIFAIKSKCQFIAAPSYANRIAKISDLLNELGLGDRIVNDKDASMAWQKMTAPIAYEQVYGKIDCKKRSSLMYLKEALRF